MAISVDTVYQRVLALANKEQRGYITPQEFNLLANQAQLQVFESYFYTKNHREISEPDRDPHTTETDISKLIDQKLKPFTTVQGLTGGGTTLPTTVSGDTVFQTGKIFYNDGSYPRPCREVELEELNRLLASTRHIGNEPVYVESWATGEDIRVYVPGDTVPQKTGNISCECITVPDDVAWGYVVVNNKALYNSNTSTNFQLHISEEDTLVTKILELAGIVLKKSGLVSTAAQKDAGDLQIQNI